MRLFNALFGKSVQIPTFLVTLDALGTLYKFRKPVAVQYLEVARQCGLEAKLDPKELDKAFRQSFKHHNIAYPNYGKDKLESPEEWWNLVVRQAFGQLVEGRESALPPNLGGALYKHFSSGTAYEPFPDVRPFLRSIAALKRRCTDVDGPMVLTGVVTNSDPRVRVVLQDMGFRVGPSKIPDFQDVRKFVGEQIRNSTGLESVFRDYYNINNDFDVLSTSYDAEAEKPEAAIWTYTGSLISPTALSRGEQAFENMDTKRQDAMKVLEAVKYQNSREKRIRIHIGDEYPKDYLGATNAGWEALHLAREDNSSEAVGRDVQVVR